MKKLLMLVLCACSLIGLNAQTKVNWGVELGLGLSSWMGNGTNGFGAMFNPSVGVKMDIPLNGLVSFQTGLNWTSKGAQDKIEDMRIAVNQNYLEMPLLAAFHFGTGKDFDVILSAGPYLACGINGKTNVEIDDVTVSWASFKDVSMHVGDWDLGRKEGLHRFDAGVRVGAALDFSHWQVGLSGEFGVCRISTDGPRNLGVFATFGYMF